MTGMSSETLLPSALRQSLQEVIESQRRMAFLQVNSELLITAAGGHLNNYGLQDVMLGRPVAEQVPFLEGFLPTPEIPFFLPCVELVKDCAADIQFYGDADEVWIVFIDVTTQRREAQLLQQRAYEMTLLQEREALLNRRLEAANAALRTSQHELEASREALLRVHERLNAELREAAAYVRSLLPPPMSTPFVTDWRFVPATEVGGDAFGYHWLDADHFAVYPLDVSGHDIGPSLMSVAVLHLLQSASRRNVDFRDPAGVLRELNSCYPMESNNDLFFTLWYGVYQPRSRQLSFSCAGHPPAFLVHENARPAQLLKTKGLPIGLMPNSAYVSETITIPRDARFYLTSDGAYEVQRTDGGTMNFVDLVEFLSTPTTDVESDLDRLYPYLLAAHGGDRLDDDFSILRIDF